MRIESTLNEFGHTLIAGAGPAAIQIAVHLSKGYSKKIGLYNRPGNHADRMKEELNRNQSEVSLTLKSETSDQCAEKAKINRFYDHADDVTDSWDTLIICTPCNSYTNVVTTLNITKWERLNTIILISPNIGSNDLVKSYLQDRNNVEVISMSTYYAATKFKSSDSVITAHTKAFKKRIYISSSIQDSFMLNVLHRFLQDAGVEGSIVKNPIEAEARNITTYVHPPLFMNTFTLMEIFNLHDSGNKFMYKLYPEGPITPNVIKKKVRLWKEISRLIENFNAEPINLLKFLNDDNYPVPEECLSREDIEGFMEIEETKQEYLLYIRYASILIDPYSKPDENGRYFEFSAVPYKKVDIDQLTGWHIPRIPFEDYQKIKVIYGLGQKAGIKMPEMKSLIETFETEVEKIEARFGGKISPSEMFNNHSINDIETIMKERGRRL